MVATAMSQSVADQRPAAIGGERRLVGRGALRSGSAAAGAAPSRPPAQLPLARRSLSAPRLDERRALVSDLCAMSSSPEQDDVSLDSAADRKTPDGKLAKLSFSISRLLAGQPPPLERPLSSGEQRLFAAAAEPHSVHPHHVKVTAVNSLPPTPTSLAFGHFSWLGQTPPHLLKDGLHSECF